jgi:hypothetical protein
MTPQTMVFVIQLFSIKCSFPKIIDVIRIIIQEIHINVWKRSQVNGSEIPPNSVLKKRKEKKVFYGVIAPLNESL